ncbi:MAG: N-6 DNA methylase [Candidatus Obscuribacterales bacterium]|nr:N-6 DNA methylase [Candidatus Obscuribacterales bacterium]
MSEADVFGKVQLLALASLLSKTDASKIEEAGASKIAQQAKLLFIELCAIALLRKTNACFDTSGRTNLGHRVELENDDDVKRLSDELLQQIPHAACEDALSGAFWLMSVYEHLTSFRLEVSNSCWCLTPSVIDKRKRGQYFTPRNLTQIATHSTLQKLLALKLDEKSNALQIDDLTALKIVDPAMGAGAFLVCALDFLAKKIERPAWREIAENCLYGVDLDPLAAGVTYYVLAFFCSLKLHSHVLEVLPELKEHLKVGNSLLGCWIDGDGALIQKRELDRIICSDDFASDEYFDSNIFHWQIEFAEVMQRGGFDAVLCNPPWETLKPNAREFFSTHDEKYRAIGLAESEIHQEQLLQKSPALRNRWQAERKFFEGFNRYLRISAERAKNIKTKYGINRPFKAQGNSDLNSYKLFTELAYCLLAGNGCMSLIVPSGIYTDQGTKTLRDLLFFEADVFEIISYLNKDQTFAIHPSFNFCVFSLCKKTSNGQIRVSFGNLNASQSTPASLETFAYPLADLQTFSPKWRSLLEISDERDLKILRKIYSQSSHLAQTILEDGADIKFKREFDLTNDSSAFVGRQDALNRGYICDHYGNFLKGNWQSAHESKFLSADAVLDQTGEQFVDIGEIESVLLPVYEGRMLGQYDCRQKAYVSGSGRSAAWNANSDGSQLIQSQYLLPLLVAKKRCNLNSLKIGYLAVGSSTNVRTMIAAALTGVPCGNSVPVLKAGESLPHNLALLVCLNSFVFDFVLRSKMTGNNINFYLLQDCPLPDLNELAGNMDLLRIVASLSFDHRRFARELLHMQNAFDGHSAFCDSLSSVHRLNLRAALDALVAQAYGLSFDDFAWVLRGCDGSSELPNGTLKGFWRVNKAQESSHRHTTLALEHFQRLLDAGTSAFCHNLLVSYQGTSEPSVADSRKQAKLANDAQNLERILALAH